MSNFSLTHAGRYALRSLDLGESECDPIHSTACGHLGWDPKSEETGVVQVLGWRDCPELDELGEDAQVYCAIKHAGDLKGEIFWTAG